MCMILSLCLPLSLCVSVSLSRSETSVCYVLYKYDFGDVWVNKGAGDEKAFLKEFKERVLSIQGPYNTDKNGATV